jgi:twinkle protein
MKPTLTTFNDIADSIGKYHANPSAYKGKSTGISKLDELVTLKEGNLHIITGIPSSGKSELLDQIMLNTIALHDWHWTVFSPENWPLESHFSKLAEKWTGKPWSKQGHVDGISADELEQARDWLSNSIAFADVPEGMMSLDALIEATKDSDKMNTTNALLLDPWNELDGKLPSGISETNHISACLSTLRNFARKSEIAVFIVAHPTKLQKRDDGNYPVPTPYDINGSAAWRNKGDVCISVWRDYGLNDGIVQVHVQKIRNKMLGKLGMAELNWCWANGLFFSEKVEPADGAKYAIKNRVI